MNGTFEGNEVTLAGGIPQGVVWSRSGASTLVQNTVIVSTPGLSTKSCEGTLTSLGNNLISDPAGCTIQLQPTDLTGNPGLGAFVDDGSPGNGHFPLVDTSQVIGAANRDACTTKDQIGRPRGGSCDIGAVEFDGRAQGPPAR